MCIRQDIQHTVCGHRDISIESCSDLDCPSTKDGTSEQRASHVHVRGTEDITKDDMCRQCKIDVVIAQTPCWYLLTPEWIRLATEANLVGGYFATEALKTFNEQRIRSFQRVRNVIAGWLAVNPLPLADLENLPEEQRSCPYSHDAGDLAPVDDNVDSESLIQLPCGCPGAFGSVCLTKLLGRGEPCPRCGKSFRFNPCNQLRVREFTGLKRGGG